MNAGQRRERDKFLVVDVSNSFTKFAWSTEAKLGGVQHLPTPKLTVQWLQAILCRRPEARVYLSSVVPRCTQIFKQVGGERLENLHGEADLGLPVDYPQRRQIGADRLANAIAARFYFGSPCIVLDFGTAVTFDIVDSRGAYCGGVIAPGLNAMTDYLHERTALLPKVELREPRSAIGKSTVEAIRAGTMIGYRGMIREILLAIRRELHLRKKIMVVATGGQAQLVTRKLPEITWVRPHLTLEGLRIWAGYIAEK
jgi:type III pantothenate kinase